MQTYYNNRSGCFVICEENKPKKVEKHNNQNDDNNDHNSGNGRYDSPLRNIINSEECMCFEGDLNNGYNLSDFITSLNSNLTYHNSDSSSKYIAHKIIVSNPNTIHTVSTCSSFCGNNDTQPSTDTVLYDVSSLDNNNDDHENCTNPTSSNLEVKSNNTGEIIIIVTHYEGSTPGQFSLCIKEGSSDGGSDGGSDGLSDGGSDEGSDGGNDGGSNGGSGGGSDGGSDGGSNDHDESNNYNQ